ncbi:MAG: class I SAM-dependent methyltransferase [Anaerolineae bacterium]|nr:class I SAM-dependent methyltransferase [Anaerolineae bacterium]
MAYSADPLEWLTAQLGLIPASNAAEFWYERMDSQSGRSLPVIYVAFDGSVRPHVCDRGAILDFALAVGPGRVLDFGPGDGWPSLILAERVSSVVGVDGSPRRVSVCQENAARLGIDNATFVHVPPGEALPFAEGTFDGVTAASSVEQTPDPQATLRELQRVLKPGGRLRLRYEALERYRDGEERDVDWGNVGIGRSRLLLFERHIDAEIVRHLGLILDLPLAAVKDRLGGYDLPGYAELVPSSLTFLRQHVHEAATWTTRHPACSTWLRWLGEVGFSSAVATDSGERAAGRIYDALDAAQRPRDSASVDAMIEPAVRAALARDMGCASWYGWSEPPITAIK